MEAGSQSEPKTKSRGAGSSEEPPAHIDYNSDREQQRGLDHRIQVFAARGLFLGHVEAWRLPLVQTFAARDQNFVTGQLVDCAHRKISIAEHLNELIGAEC